AEPVLAEVVFPVSFSIADAKAFLYQELDELTVQSSGRSACWVEEPDRLVFRFSDDPKPTAQAVFLDPGVRELVGVLDFPQNGHAGAGQWQTCCLEFDRQAGWDRDRAEDWVQRHLRVRDLGRTARLDVPHRMDPELATFLSHLLFAGAYRIVG